MERFSLDLYLTRGSVYETGKREALVIQKVGTNAADPASPANLRIDDKPLGKITQDLSPLHKINTRFVPLLDLGDLFYVVPPETEVIVEGPSGAIIRCKGYLLKLAPAEVLPTNLMARFSAQPNHYMTFIRGTYSHGTDVALAADAEVEVISYTPKTIEKAILNGLVMAKVANYTESEQDLAIRFFLEGAPLDFILEKTKTGGIDFMSARYPPNETEEHEAFSLAETPIEVPGDHTLSVKARNISGGSISPATGTSLNFDIAAIIEYQTGV